MKMISMMDLMYQSMIVRIRMVSKFFVLAHGFIWMIKWSEMTYMFFSWCFSAEDNPRNEYPDEISEEEEEEGEEEEEEDESEDESERESSSAASDVGQFSEYYDYLSDDSLHLDYYGNEEDDGDDANNRYSYC